ncbi:MAG: AMIN domain-containing protein [Deltaproteobacteria bacterium]|nr:AMIN domain-containing protein [Deltaproteobacteria bacterium]
MRGHEVLLMNLMKTRKGFTLLLIAGLCLSNVALSFAADWGTIMYPRGKTYIRAKRSVHSKVRGQLRAGQPVKVDFLKNNWYAVFRVKEKRRNEARALGYVQANLLYRRVVKPTDVPVSREKETVTDSSVMEFPDSVPIDVKNISVKTGETGHESLVIEFNRFYTPAFYSIEGSEPKIVLDITNVSSFKKEWEYLSVQGKFIRQLRSSMNPNARMVRIVVDMEPAKDYSINPVFSGKDNSYSLHISEDKKQAP